MKFKSEKTGSLEIREGRRIKKFDFVEGIEYEISEAFQVALINEGFTKKIKKKGE